VDDGIEAEKDRHRGTRDAGEHRTRQVARQDAQERGKADSGDSFEHQREIGANLPGCTQTRKRSKPGAQSQVDRLRVRYRDAIVQRKTPVFQGFASAHGSMGPPMLRAESEPDPHPRTREPTLVNSLPLKTHFPCLLQRRVPWVPSGSLLSANACLWPLLWAVGCR
jgi:hypothetical protein